MSGDDNTGRKVMIGANTRKALGAALAIALAGATAAR
jgi:hypothetical protein